MAAASERSEESGVSEWGTWVAIVVFTALFAARWLYVRRKLQAIELHLSAPPSSGGGRER